MTIHAKTFEEVTKDGTRRSILIRERGHRCESCGLSEWKNEKIPLELDHIDGNSDRNEKENLRLLCPNCHALTPTWRGRNHGKFGMTKRKMILKAAYAGVAHR